METFCRTWYCQECFARGDPHKGNQAVLFGRTHQCFFTTSVNGGVRGFTPHIISFINRIGGNVLIDVQCGVCGFDEKMNCISKSNFIWMPDNHFEALIKRPDLGYKID